MRRGARNHAAIVEATCALIREGAGLPTAEQIAARAGVGLRTVFRQFDDLDQLFAGVTARVLTEVLADGPPPAPTGDLDADLDALIARRARGYEHVGPFLRAARLVRVPPAAWRRFEAMAERALRDAGDRALAPHLAGVAGPAREALNLVLSFEAWDRLRTVQHLGVDQARATLRAATAALLRR